MEKSSAHTSYKANMNTKECQIQPIDKYWNIEYAKYLNMLAIIYYAKSILEVFAQQTATPGK